MSESNSVFRLPVRKGPLPRTDNSVPHLQKTQRSPDHIRIALLEWAPEFLSDVTEQDTRISVTTTRAFWLSEEVDVSHDDAFMPPAGGREFAHLHKDGSLHLCVSAAAFAEILEKNWGESHPLRDKGVNEVLFFAPRDSGELETAKYAVAEAWSYATGMDNPVGPIDRIND